MNKTFSTKMDSKVLRLLDSYCETYHVKKSRLLEELITEGIHRKQEMFELAESIQRGLEDEAKGKLVSSAEVAKRILGKKK